LTIALVGLSQRTAPVALRERLSKALGPCGCAGDTPPAASPWWGTGYRESALLSTCNRLEVYAVPDGTHDDLRGLIVGRLGELGDLPRRELEPHIYHREDEDAVWHLFRVSCGLDSQVVGETQILGQVSQAFAAARANGTSGPLLTHLFSRAAHAGKRARSETEIGRGTTSISHAAVSLLEKELGDLSSRKVLVIGAGETAELAAQALYKHGARNVTVVNRTLASAQTLASRFGYVARPWAELAGALADAEAAVTATGSPHPVIYEEDVAPVLAQRHGVPLVFVDIAVPRDVDLGVGTLPGVVLHDIDKLEATLDHNLSRRLSAVPRVEEIVAEETQVAMEWLHGREATVLLAELREHAHSVAETELRGALRKLDGLDKDAEEVVSRMANRIVSKLLHQPTKQLKSRASSDDFEVYCDAVVDLFGLKHTRIAHSEGLAQEDNGC
jgi:glutamyl-tRNA reductase